MKTVQVWFLLAVFVAPFALCNAATDTSATLPENLAKIISAEDANNADKKFYLSKHINPCKRESESVNALGTILRAGGYVAAYVFFPHLADKITNFLTNKFESLKEDKILALRVCGLLGTLIAFPAYLYDEAQGGKRLIKNQCDISALLAGAPGALFEWLFLRDEKLLQRTVKAFVKNPDFFPEEAKSILEEIKMKRNFCLQTYDYGILNKEQITEVCAKLRAIARS